MSKTRTKSEIKVMLAIQPGPVTPFQRTVWQRFWQKMIDAAKKDERKNQQY